eukprot:jgi/Chlat1/4612/Chrsp293S04363
MVGPSKGDVGVNDGGFTGSQKYMGMGPKRTASGFSVPGPCVLRLGALENLLTSHAAVPEAKGTAQLFGMLLHTSKEQDDHVSQHVRTAQETNLRRRRVVAGLSAPSSSAWRLRGDTLFCSQPLRMDTESASSLMEQEGLLLSAAAARPASGYLRRSVEFQWFLMALSVLPEKLLGRVLE